MHAIITVGNLYSSIRFSEPLSEPLKYAFENTLSYWHKQSWFVKNDHWDGRIKLFWSDRGNLFYTGVLSMVREILDQTNITYEYEFIRKRPEANMPHLALRDVESIEDREYQTVTIEMLYEATRGILQAATGSGKTFMIASLISQIKTGPFIFYVMSQDLLEQAHEELSKFLNVPIGKVGAGEVDIQDVNVVMVQTAIKAINRDNPKFNVNLYKYDEEDKWMDLSEKEVSKADEIEKLIRDAKGLFLDECHHASCKLCQTVLEASKFAYWRYGGSATPKREDGQDLMIQALFGRKIVEISASLLIKQGYLVRPYIFNVIMKEDHGDFENYGNVYKHYVTENDTLNELVARLITYFEKHEVSSLTLVKQYNHGDTIGKLHGDVPFIKGNQTKKKRKKTLDTLRSGEAPSAIATTLADEGLDVKRLGAVLMAGGGKSVSRVFQRVGRGLRTFTFESGEKKDKAIIVMFHHKCKFLDGHGKTVKRLLAQEPVFVVKDSTPERIFDDIDEVIFPDESFFD